MPALHTCPIFLSHYCIQTHHPQSPAPLLRTSSLLTSLFGCIPSIYWRPVHFGWIWRNENLSLTGVSLVEIKSSSRLSSIASLFYIFLFSAVLSLFGLVLSPPIPVVPLPPVLVVILPPVLVSLLPVTDVLCTSTPPCPPLSLFFYSQVLPHLHNLVHPRSRP